MTIRIPAALCVAVVCLAGCGSPSVGTISGKVLMSDGSDATGLTVTLLGQVGKSEVTVGGGQYSFEKLPDGVYLLSVEAADTKERKLSFGATVKGTEAVPAPDLTFNPVGTLTGKVTTAAMSPAVGATVFLSGSDRVALTDATGSYRFADVPTGDYTLVAKAAGAINQSATATIKLKRGKNDGPALALANDMAVTGKLDGVVYYFNGDKPAGIKVSVVDVSNNTDDAGHFSLTLPPGTYALIAEAAGYPKQQLGWFTVRAGETTTVPATPISLYKSIPIYEQATNPFLSWLAVSEGPTAILRMQNTSDYQTAIYAIDTKAVDRKLLLLGSPSNYHLSKQGKWFAFQPGFQGVAAINTETGKTYTFPGSIITGPLISSDESVMMYWSQGQNTLFRVDLATGAVTSFPAFAGSLFQSADRFLARTSNMTPFDVQLITPTTATVAFSQMQVEFPVGATNVQVGSVTNTTPLVFAYNCAAACNVQVIGLTGNSSSAVNIIPTTQITQAPSPINGSVKEYLGLQWGGLSPGRILVKVADGSATPLPANTTNLFFNETLARVVTYSINAGNGTTDVREDVVPPSATGPIHLNAPGIQNQAWISPTRFIAFSSSPNPKKLEMKAGVPSLDVNPDIVFDVAAQTPYFAPPAVMWLKQTSMKRVGIAYDSAEFPVDTIGAMSNFNFTSVGSRASVLNGLLGKFAVIYDGASAHVFDGVKAESRKSPGQPPSQNNPLFIPTDRFRVSLFGPNGFFAQSIALEFFETGKTLMLTEPLRLGGQTASLPTGGTITATYSTGLPNNTLNLALLP